MGRKGRGGFSLPRPSPRPAGVQPQPRHLCRTPLQQPQSHAQPVGIHGVGFSTASGQKVNVSDKSLSKARGLLSKIEMSDIKNASSRVGFVQSQVSPHIGPSMGGFSTARGSPVTVSEQALAKARGLLATEKETTVKKNENSPRPVVQPGTPVTGFSTGRGKPVVVSEDALAKARGVLARSESGAKSGFSTGRGDPVIASEEALIKARAIVATSSGHQQERNEKNPAPGFSTARGQQVVISDQALSRARKVLADGARPVDSETKTPLGFSTGRGAPVTVSKAALDKVRGALEEDKHKVGCQLPPAMSGFSTGRGQPVKISEEALARAKTLVPSGNPNGGHLESKSDSVDWGEEDDNDMVSMATMAEEADQLNFQPYRCKPYDFKPPPFAYRGGPELLQEQTANATNFHTPYTGGKAQKREAEGYDAVLVKRRKERVEEDEEEKVDDLAGRRARCRTKQEMLIVSKKNKNVRAMPGRLIQKRSSNPRSPLLPFLDRRKSCSNRSNNVTSTNASQWRFRGSEHFSTGAVQEADQVALGDGIWLVLDDDGDFGLAEVNPGIRLRFWKTTFSQVSRAFLCCPGVDPSCLPDGWIENHYRFYDPPSSSKFFLHYGGQTFIALYLL